jgi:hypothetical protein
MKKNVVKNVKNEVVKNAKNEGVKILNSEEYTSLFCKTLKNAVDSNRGILASVFLALNAGVEYQDLLTFAKTSCGVEWNDSNRAFYSQPIRAGKNLFNKMKNDSSFLKIVNNEKLTLEEKNKGLIDLIKLKKLSVNSLLRGKQDKQDKQDKQEKNDSIDCSLLNLQSNQSIEEKITNDLFTLQDKYKNNIEDFILACFSIIEFLSNNDFDKMKSYLNKYIELSSNIEKVA